MLAFCVASITNLSKTPQTSNTKIYIFTIWKLFPEFFYSLNVFKGRWADMRRRPGAKHCSSLCSQSEGGEYCGGQALKIQQSHAPERWPCSLRVRGPHFASKVSYNAGAATDDYAGPHKLPNFPTLIFLFSPIPYPKKTKNPATHMWGHGVAGLFMIVFQNARSVALATGRAACCQSAMSENSAPEAKSWPLCSLTARKRM